MAIDKFPELKELTVKAPNKGIISFIAAGTIPMWSPVVLGAGGTGIIPVVSESVNVNDPKIIGIAVGGSGTPVNPNGTTGTAALDGDIVDVAVLNSGVITKCKVDGSTIGIGSLLVTSANNGLVTLFVPPTYSSTVDSAIKGYILGKALQARTTTGDTILIFMGGSI